MAQWLKVVAAQAIDTRVLSSEPSPQMYAVRACLRVCTQTRVDTCVHQIPANGLLVSFYRLGFIFKTVSL